MKHFIGLSAMLKPEKACFFPICTKMEAKLEISQHTRTDSDSDRHGHVPVINFSGIGVFSWPCYRFHKIVIDIGRIYIHLYSQTMHSNIYTMPLN